MVDLAFSNVTDFSAGDSATITLPGAPDTDFGFFMIANGAHKNNDYKKMDLDEGAYSFIYHHGEVDERLAKITDNEDDIQLVFENFDESVKDLVVVGSNNHIYHTTSRDGSTSLNGDGAVHVVSGVMEGSDGGTLRIGFEDLPNLGDADYNDVVFDVTVHSNSGTATVISDADVLMGGEGDDVLMGGIGSDGLYGGAPGNVIVALSPAEKSVTLENAKSTICIVPS